MKPYLSDTLQCPDCAAELDSTSTQESLQCIGCGQTFDVKNGTPIFSPPPEGIVPSEKLVRGPEVGTPWRQANWRFLQAQLTDLEQDALILDVGSGRGDFSDALQERHYVALDVYPYPEADIVCDLTDQNPFKPARFDAILLMNVLEHVYDSRALLETLSGLLKPGGILVIAIPFLVKLHQEPVDYVRYTHYALSQLGESCGLELKSLEGYYDPVFFLEEGIGNIRYAYLPAINGINRYLARALIFGIQTTANLLSGILGKGESVPPSSVRSKAPTGYQLVFRRPGSPDPLP